MFDTKCRRHRTEVVQNIVRIVCDIEFKGAFVMKMFEIYEN